MKEYKKVKLRTKKLNLFYGNTYTLKNIYIEIPSNQITAFLGPSGCGKSSLLKTFNRLGDLIRGCRITGTVTLDGINIYDEMEVAELRRRVGMVFQKPNPFPMSVYDNVAYGPRIYGSYKRPVLNHIVEESLRKAVLWNEVKDRLKEDARGLSGGQQQRLCIARALAVKPEVLLMDEATSALDPISTEQIEKLCLSLKKDYTIILVTHNMQQAGRISDRVAFFFNGELIEYGTARAILENPKDKRTVNFVGSLSYDRLTF